MTTPLFRLDKVSQKHAIFRQKWVTGQGLRLKTLVILYSQKIYNYYHL